MPSPLPAHRQPSQAAACFAICPPLRLLPHAPHRMSPYLLLLTTASGRKSQNLFRSEHDTQEKCADCQLVHSGSPGALVSSSDSCQNAKSCVNSPVQKRLLI